jgi:O-succinylbenzoic acid--CoA ligase
MTGYLDDPQATETTLAEGWLRTGDVGVLDDAGRLRVLDRRSDLILSGGENVYPAEIESVLDDHEDVIEAGVCGVPDEKFGARPVAFLVLREGASLDVEEMAEFCQTRLASYKCPTTFNQSVVLPRTPTGKLIRHALLDD